MVAYTSPVEGSITLRVVFDSDSTDLPPTKFFNAVTDMETS
jgi:hypothetical protein